MASSNNLARTTVTSSPGTVANSPAAKFRAYIAERAALESTSAGEDVSASQVEKILAAETADDIFDADLGTGVQARDVCGLEVEIHAMRLQLSDRFDGSPYYANIDATVMGGPAEVLTRNGLTVGQSALIQTGAELIIAKVRAFEAKGMLPVRAVIVGVTTSSGNTVLKLGKPALRSVTVK